MGEDDEATPLLFANKVIHQFVSNLLGRGVDGQSSAKIRVIFRHYGGEWERLAHGDPVHIGLLLRVIQAWGQSAAKTAPDPRNQEVYASA